ncbi:RNA polymerase sigma factor [Parapedobacter soli]|uniref:RNA polymerase sigma factor n=1 Tax=Parapedobacter soli TaxID=416955 RepID=UPI0021C6A6D5|nr:RNA polymerase sigma-70 factor [Parapedobacter soli]
MKIEKNIDENELLRRISRGDQSAFGALFKSYHPFVYAFGRRITRSDELAEEVVQDVFLKIWVDRESLEKIDNFGAYLNRIVRNHCYNVLRKLAMESRHASLLSAGFDDTDDSTAQQLDYNDVNEVLEDAIQTLSTQQKNVYQLCHQRGLTYQEASDELGISRQTVHAYMKDALRKIRDHFRKHGILYAVFIAVLFK